MSNDATKSALASRRTSNGGDSKSGSADLRVLIERQKPEIARALVGTALDPERFTRIALTTLRQNAALQRCRPESVLGALMTSAQLGLEPGPLGEAYLVPYKDECTFIVGYRGLEKLAWQSQMIRHIDADVVREGDQFEYAKGAEPKLVHIPAMSDRGDPMCFYAVASFVTGGHVSVVMSPEDVNHIRRRSPAGNSKSSPWHTDYAAMAKKTCIRQLAKFLPMATSMNRAAAVDGSVRTGVGDDLEDLSTGWIDGEVLDEGAEPETEDATSQGEGPPQQPHPNPPPTEDEGSA